MIDFSTHRVAALHVSVVSDGLVWSIHDLHYRWLLTNFDRHRLRWIIAGGAILLLGSHILDPEETGILAQKKYQQRTVRSPFVEGRCTTR